MLSDLGVTSPAPVSSPGLLHIEIEMLITDPVGGGGGGWWGWGGVLLTEFRH